MALDDHEVSDDLGRGCIPASKVFAGLTAYQSWQHSHNPGGPDKPFHYGFTWGPAAFYVLDCRSEGRSATFPVLGRDQFNRLRSWAESPAVQESDVVFVVSPVPPALLPTELLRALAQGLIKRGGMLAGLAVGLVVGGSFGPGAGLAAAAVLGATGYAVGDEVFEEWVDPFLLNDVDLAERWDLAANQVDLVRLLDLLFGLANGTVGSTRSKRAVFLLGGDIHAGTVHSVASLPRPGRPDHSGNPIIYQLTSSAISHPPVDQDGYEALVAGISGESRLAKLAKVAFPGGEPPLIPAENKLAPWRTTGPAVVPTVIDRLAEFAEHEGPACFLLDPDEGRNYVAQYAGLIVDRTVGSANVRRISAERRVYRFDLAIEGESSSIRSSFDLNLDADEVVPILDGAAFETVDGPATVTRGERFEVTATVRNTGAAAWGSAHDCEIFSGPWAGKVQQVDGRVEPGRTHTFRFLLPAVAPSLFRIGLRMRRRRGSNVVVGVFGGGSHSVDVAAAAGADVCQELRDAESLTRRRIAALRQDIIKLGEPTASQLAQMAGLQAELRGIEAGQAAAGC